MNPTTTRPRVPLQFRPSWSVALIVSLAAGGLADPAVAGILPDDPHFAGNLGLWLRADDVNTSGSTVTQWNDKSAGGNNGVGSGDPQLVASDPLFNYQPVVAFDGSGDYFEVMQNLYPGDRDLTVLAVARTDVTNPADNSIRARIWTMNKDSASNSTIMTIGQDQDMKLAIGWNNGSGFTHPETSAVLDTGTPFLATLTQETSSSRARVHYNDTEVYDNTSFSFTTDVGPNTHFWVGAQGTGTARFWDGDIAEIIVYDRPLTGDERVALGQYLNGRYDLGMAAADDALLGVATANSGGLTNLTSVTTAKRGTVAAEDLVDVDVFHWHASSSSNTVLSPGGADPGTGNRATLIDGDLALNTGMINPGDSGTLTPAEQATLGPGSSSENGLGVMFDGGLMNSPGIDLLVVELAYSGQQDGFRINRIDGVAGDLIVDPADYAILGSNLNTNLVSPNSSTLNAFESSGTWSGGGGVDQGWAAVGIDLSDLGYAAGEVAPGLLFSDAPGTGNVDFVLIRGFQAIPEPSSVVLLVLGMALSLLAAARRRRR